MGVSDWGEKKQIIVLLDGQLGEARGLDDYNINARGLVATYATIKNFPTDNDEGGNVDNNDTGGDSNNGTGADNGDGSDNGDNNATDPTQDPNKVCLSKYFKYGNGKIIEDLKKGDKDAYNEDTDEGYSDGTKHQVKELQKFLEAFGYDVGTNGADGWFGSDTKSALIEFQKKNSLDADGIVGPNTRDAMNRQKCYDK